VYDRHPDRVDKLCKMDCHCTARSSVEAIRVEEPAYLIEAASREFVARVAPDLLSKGLSVICLSSGALSDASVRQQIMDAARAGGSKCFVPVAPPATDAVTVLSLTGLSSAKYRSARGIGHPRAEPGREGIYFSGSVHQAMAQYPHALNPAAVLAEAANGYDATLTEVAFESSIEGYEFRTDACSDVGNVRATLSGPVNGDWTFSTWAVFSTIALLRKLMSPLVIGP